MKRWVGIYTVLGIFGLFIGVTTAFGQENSPGSSTPGNTAVSDTAKTSGKQWVAIDKFENKSKVGDDLFQSLRTRITNEIINTRKFEVVEREQLKSVLSEQQLQQQGLTNTEESPDAPASGKMKAAGYVLYGTVLHLGLDTASGAVGDVVANRADAKVELQLRIANAENGKILASKEVISRATYSNIASSGTDSGGNQSEQLIESAIRNAASDVVGELMALAYPIRIVAVSTDAVTINLAKEQAELGKRLKVYSEGEELTDPDTGESLGKDERYLGELVITEVKPKVSICQPRKPLKADQLERGMVVRPVSSEEKKKEAAKEKAERTQAFESRF